MYLPKCKARISSLLSISLLQAIFPVSSLHIYKILSFPLLVKTWPHNGSECHIHTSNCLSSTSSFYLIFFLMLILEVLNVSIYWTDCKFRVLNWFRFLFQFKNLVLKCIVTQSSVGSAIVGKLLEVTWHHRLPQKIPFLAGSAATIGHGTTCKLMLEGECMKNVETRDYS